VQRPGQQVDTMKINCLLKRWKMDFLGGQQGNQERIEIRNQKITRCMKVQHKIDLTDQRRL
jgi:hypothetical protein